MSNLKRHGRLRWSPSYLRNRGQLTRAQKRALREWWPRVGIRFEHGKRIELDEHFAGDGPLVIEIGFGMGDHLVSLAGALPDHRILGIEVHRPGLAAATAKIRELGLENVRLVRGDARLVMTDHLPEGIASAVLVQFPDPWPKPGDAHRRLVQPGFVEVLERILEPRGEFVLVTDVADYAGHVRDVFAESGTWVPTGDSEWITRRVPTPYEKKGEGEGREAIELAYRFV